MSDLASLCREVVELNRPPEADRMLEMILGRLYSGGGLMAQRTAYLPPPNADPLDRYDLECIWKDVLAPPLSLPDWEEKYWRNQANSWFLHAGPDNELMKRTIDRLEFAEAGYLAEAEAWVTKRLELDLAIIESDERMRRFYRHLLKDIQGLKIKDPWVVHQFTKECWNRVIHALDRFYRVNGGGMQKVLTIRQHAKNRKLAEKLKDNIDQSVEDLPWDFEPEYKWLSRRLTQFLQLPEPRMTPKRSHAKNPRQVLIRELFAAWNVGTFPLSPVNHVYHLAEVVDEDITQNDIHREYNRFLASKKTA